MSKGKHETREALHPQNMRVLISAIVGTCFTQAFPFDFQDERRLLELKRSIDNHMPDALREMINELKPICRCEGCIEDEKENENKSTSNPRIMRPHS